MMSVSGDLDPRNSLKPGRDPYVPRTKTRYGSIAALKPYIPRPETSNRMHE